MSLESDVYDLIGIWKQRLYMAPDTTKEERLKRVLAQEMLAELESLVP